MRTINIREKKDIYLFSYFITVYYEDAKESVKQKEFSKGVEYTISDNP